MEYEQIEALCTNVLDTKTAFAVRFDTGAQVFIPSTVADRVGLVPGDVVLVTVVPNRMQPERTPWFAIRVDRTDVPKPEPQPEPELELRGALESQVVEFIAHQSLYATTAEIAEQVGIDTATASNTLNRLFRKGLVARAEVYSKPDQKRPSFCLWAKDTSRFVEEAEI